MKGRKKERKKENRKKDWKAITLGSTLEQCIAIGPEATEKNADVARFDINTTTITANLYMCGSAVLHKQS
jgi:hypothetical protein